MSDTDSLANAALGPDKHQVDVSALTVWLERNISGFKGPVALKKFEGGQSNPTYKLTTPTHSYVMRAKPAAAAALLPSAHAVGREFTVMRGLAGTEAPVPTVLALCEDEAVIGREFYVMEYVEGRVFWDPSLPGMTNVQRAEIYDELNRVMAALHRVNYIDRGLRAFGKPGNYFQRQILRWVRQYKASADDAGPMSRPIEAMERLVEWLPANIPDIARDDRFISIVHGDYGLHNMIFHPTEARIMALLDWELSTLGHPLADFSYHCAFWHIPVGLPRGIGGLDHASLGIPDEETYVRRYCERTRLFSPDDVRRDWNFFLAYNMFRIAAMMQGIAKRAETGTAASTEAGVIAAGARPMAELAWTFALRTSIGA